MHRFRVKNQAGFTRSHCPCYVLMLTFPLPVEAPAKTFEHAGDCIPSIARCHLLVLPRLFQSSVPISTIEDNLSSIAYTGLNDYAFVGETATLRDFVFGGFDHFPSERSNPSADLTQEVLPQACFTSFLISFLQLSAIVRYVRSGDVAPDDYVNQNSFENRGAEGQASIHQLIFLCDLIYSCRCWISS